MSSPPTMPQSKLAYMTTPIGQRIRKARTAKGLTQQEVADAVGVSRATVAQWENGDTKELKGENLLQIAGLFQFKFESLVTSKKPRAPMNALPPPDMRGIPIVGNTQGGPDHQWVEMDYPVGYGDEYIAMTSRDPHAYALRVRGNSMAPRIREGEVILVEPTTVAEAGDDVVVRTLDGQVMVKTLVSTRNGETILDSIAKDYDRIVLRQEKIEWIHPVMGVIPARSILKRNTG